LFNSFSAYYMVMRTILPKRDSEQPLSGVSGWELITQISEGKCLPLDLIWIRTLNCFCVLSCWYTCRDADLILMFWIVSGFTIFSICISQLHEYMSPQYMMNCLLNTFYCFVGDCQEVIGIKTKYTTLIFIIRFWFPMPYILLQINFCGTD